MLSTLISKRNRTKKYHRFLNLIMPKQEDKILDVGFNDTEHSSVDNFLEKNYPYLNKITALGVDSDSIFKKNYPLVNTVIYDGSIFPFENKSFDIGWSNAVIEHVGDRSKQLLFLTEIHRTCKTVYMTTPNRYFPVEVHTRIPLLHWLPKNIFDKLLSYTPKKWASGDYMHLLSYKQIVSLMKEANVTNYKIYRNRFCGFTMDFSIVIGE